MSITNLRDTIIPKSDQLNAEQLLAGPMTLTVTGVRRGSTDEQPIIIDYDGDAGRPYKPCKTMRKVLIAVWGDDGRLWVGRSMIVYCNPDVKFGGVRVGGIRISHLSDIPADTSLSLTETKGRKAVHVVRRLEMPARDDHLAALRIAAGVGTAALVAAWGQVPAAVRRSLGSCPQDLKDAAAQADREHAAAETPRDSTAPVLDALNAAAGVRDA